MKPPLVAANVNPVPVLAMRVLACLRLAESYLLAEDISLHLLLGVLAFSSEPYSFCCGKQYTELTSLRAKPEGHIVLQATVVLILTRVLG